jgi:hypothetical protein
MAIDIVAYATTSGSSEEAVLKMVEAVVAVVSV